MKSALLPFVGLSVLQCVNARGYYKASTIQGGEWLNAFSFQAIPDPTNGRTHYVDMTTAAQNNLFSFVGSNFILRGDNRHIVQPSEPGRMSFRIISNNEYNHHVAIFDIVHMPEGCGTWPAIWCVSCYTSRRALTQFPFDLGYATGENWPNNGEIDIIESVNNQSPNHATLHTTPNCQMPQYRYMTGSSILNDCDVYVNQNQGCGVRFADPNSFGPNFNGKGGGWYAVEHASNYVAIYFWERSNPYVPAEVRNRGGAVDPSTWGVPAAFFVDWECSNFSNHFGPMHIVINLAFCGNWAGSTFNANGCPGSCADYVNYNPGAFSNAYFEFNYLDIYNSDSG